VAQLFLIRQQAHHLGQRHAGRICGQIQNLKEKGSLFQGPGCLSLSPVKDHLLQYLQKLHQLTHQIITFQHPAWLCLKVEQ